MKTLTQVWQEEHRLIVRATECLDRLVEFGRRTDQLCVVSAIELLEFFEQFVDLAHQEMEERCVFPMLIASGLASQRVRELIADHGVERELLSRMRSELEGAAFGRPTHLGRFFESAAHYAHMQREHAFKEERELVPLVERFLDAEAQRVVLADLESLEAHLLTRAPIAYAGLVEGVERRLLSSSMHAL